MVGKSQFLLMLVMLNVALSAFTDFKQKAAQLGFSVEEQSFYTRDDYKLIIVKVFAKTFSTPQKPVLLMHGMGMSADSWIMHAQSATDSLPLILAGTGHDVYVGNFRGTWDYSYHKIYDKAKDKEFWEFTIDYFMIDLMETVTNIDRVNKLAKNELILMAYDKATTYSLIWMAFVEEVVDIFLDRVVLLGPCNYFNQAMPPMDDREWDALAQLELPYIHGPGWNDKLDSICSGPGHENICKNPMLLKSSRLPSDFFMNPITLNEITFFSQNYFAKQL
jgi:hypothetical protein